MKAEKLLKNMQNKLGFSIDGLAVSISNDKIVTLNGTADNWNQVVESGFFAAKTRGVKNVVNNIRVKGSIKKETGLEDLNEALSLGTIASADVVIVGAGVSGCAIARELSALNLSVIVIDKESEVSMGASKANNGMIHPGNAVKPGTLKAKMNVEGNKLYDQWARDLGFAFERTGSIIAAYKGDKMITLYLAYIAGRLNRVPGMRLIFGKKIMQIEPDVPKGAIVGLYTPSTAYVDGFEVTIALAENAAANGAKFMMDTEILGIDKNSGKIERILTSKGIIETGCVINAAGVYADEVAKMADEQFYTIHARRGAIIILDRNTIGAKRNITRVKKLDSSSHSKGGGAQRTVSGNPLLGPSAKEIENKEDTSVLADEFEYAYMRGIEMFPGAGKKNVISFFAGNRPADYKEDFIIEAAKNTPGFIHCAGIQSPGLASAPAIAKRVKGLVLNYFESEGRSITQKHDWNPIRIPPVVFRNKSREEQDKLIKENPKYGNVVCRCELVTEAEIVDAMHRNPPACTLDGIKRRTRAGAGRCQSGFCGPKIVEIMSRELNYDSCEIDLKKKNSSVLLSHSRKKEDKEMLPEASL
ncbi:MAG: FAD/NAD(P)-binding oxidoreductase [Ruminococcaceae bacterium]|nr:FAD/NAD(P)-binding oxidoreductase [Oscillospiraceae bacterium]